MTPEHPAYKHTRAEGCAVCLEQRRRDTQVTTVFKQQQPLHHVRRLQLLGYVLQL